MFFSAVDFIHQQDLVGLALEIGFYINVKVAFFLKILDQVLLTFIDQIAIDGSFGIDRDQFFQLPAGYKREQGKACSRGADDHDRADLDLE